MTGPVGDEHRDADPFDLGRFVEAQDGTYERALAELRAGLKATHWVWFVFPQIAGLGMSAMSRRFAVSGLAEASAYLAHPVLGPRLRECAGALSALPATRLEEVLGAVDALKLCSSMTLFERAGPDEPVFGAVLDRWFDGRRDPATEARL